MKRSKIVIVDGGLGRVICSIPAVEKLAEKEDVVVISGWIEPYMFNPKIKRLYHMSHPYLWDDIISKGELVQPEPYHHYLYYTQKHHLIQSFDYLLNGTEDMKVPNLYLNEDELQWGRDFISGMKKQFGDKPIVLFQPFGAGARTSGNQCATCSDPNIIDPSNRSFSMEDTGKFIDALSQFAIVLYMGTLPIGNNSKAVIPGPTPNIRQWLTIIKNVNYFFGIDSSAQHICHAFGIKGTVVLGATFKENISYANHFNIFQKESYPKTYDPIRMPGVNFTNSASEMNKGAMSLTGEERDNLIEMVKKDLGVGVNSKRGKK
jgi:hypothetical protein